MRDIAILSELNFIQTRLYGQYDDPALREHVVALNSEAADFRALSELADCRHLTDIESLTVPGCVTAGSLENDQPRAEGGSLAIVVSNPVLYGFARAYSVYPADIRARILVTYSLEEAVDWLGYSGEDKETLKVFLAKQ